MCCKKIIYWPSESTYYYLIDEKANGKIFTLGSIQTVTALPPSTPTPLAHPINQWHIVFPI